MAGLSPMAHGPFQRLRHFFAELKRRKVYRVAATYAVVGFVLIQIADLTFVRLGLPSWTVTLVIVLVAVGFPLVLIGAWAFEMTPEGMRRTPDADPVEESESAAGRTGTAYKVLLSLGLVAAAVAGGWYLTGGGDESPGVSEGTVAVLPFEVSGPDTETWREGMVTMLSTGLDGAAGLRAISEQTVLSAWERSDRSREEPGGRRFLEAARRVGAQYAVVGSAVKLGGDLQLSADLHETRSGDRLGQVEVRGSPARVTSLTDSLTRRVLGVLLEESGQSLPSVNLASLTTSSLPALKAYLQGERHFRRGAFKAAIADYNQAVDADSTFALAHWHLARSYGWLSAGSNEEGLHRRQAYELAERLPLRERRLVRADYLLRGRRPVAAADTLQRLTVAYPDDADAWYLLGEASFHYGVPPGWRQADRAFGRAVALDSSFVPYHRHRVDLAFALHRDSTGVAKRIAAHPNLSGDEPRLQMLRTLVLGDSTRRAAGIASLDTLSTPVLSRLLPVPLMDPRSAASFEATAKEATTRSSYSIPGHVMRENLVIIALYYRGQIRKALQRLGRFDLRPYQRACPVAFTQSLGIAIPDSLRPAVLDPDLLDEHITVNHAFCLGIYAAARGDSASVERAVSRIRSGMDEDTSHTVALLSGMTFEADRLVPLLRGVQARETSRLKTAVRQLSEASVWSFLVPTGLWMGDLQRRIGNLKRAEEWYLGAWNWPLAHERLGQLYEQMDRPEDAAAAYRRFIAAWEDADPELQPRVEAARKRLEGLTGSQSTTNE